MLETFFAGFLGVVLGACTISALFYWAYAREHKFAQESAEKLFQALTGEVKQTKTGSVLSLIRPDREPPVN